jgi:hypothetical protein
MVTPLKKVFLQRMKVSKDIATLTIVSITKHSQINQEH